MPDSLEQRVERYRPLIVEEMRAVVGKSDDELFRWMRYHLGWETEDGTPIDASGGKLMRPVAMLMAAEFVGGSAEQTVPAAAAVELVHNFSLLHDDIEDASPTRRGRATLWTFAGTAQAINTGDGMFTLARLAMHRLLDRDIAPDRAIEAIRRLDETCIKLVHGQYLDISFETRETVSREQYLAMARGKTAAMFAAPFAIGALLGGAPDAQVAALHDFGEQVGLAFQAVDDVLGIWGDEDVTGKPVGDDLRSRKMTLPVIVALEAGGDEAHRLTAAYTNAGAAGDDVSEMAALVERLGGRAATERFAEERVAAALGARDAVELTAEALEACSQFAGAATGRQS